MYGQPGSSFPSYIMVETAHLSGDASRAPEKKDLILCQHELQVMRGTRYPASYYVFALMLAARMVLSRRAFAQSLSLLKVATPCVNLGICR